MPSHEDVDHQWVLLQTHRRNAQQFLRQTGQHGSASVPLSIENGLKDSWENIARIKQILRTWGQDVDDLPEDAPPPTRPVVQVVSPGRRVRLTIDVTVTDVDALKAYADKVYRQAHGGRSPSEQYGKSVPAAALVLEALVLSNENPDASAYGIEISAWNAQEI